MSTPRSVYFPCFDANCYLATNGELLPAAILRQALERDEKILEALASTHPLPPLELSSEPEEWEAWDRGGLPATLNAFVEGFFAYERADFDTDALGVRRARYLWERTLNAHWATLLAPFVPGGVEAEAGFGAAVAALREACARTSGPDAACESHVRLALAQALSRDLVGARKSARIALAYAELIGDEWRQQEVLAVLAELAGRLEDYVEVERHARQGLLIAGPHAVTPLVASQHRRMAEALYRQRRRGEARPHARLAIEMLTRYRAEALRALLAG